MLEVQDLTFSIGAHQILNGVSFSIQQGEKLGIIGPNGSGKTTLFNCLSGFYTPSSGRIFFEGTDITKLSPHVRARLGIGRIFQNSGIFKEMTLLENIVIALETKGRKGLFPWSKRSKALQRRGECYLASIGLEDRAKDKAGSLSGGQLRLLEIVRALCTRADLFLLDEPTAGVSPKMTQDVLALLARLHRKKKTFIVIEHDMNFIHHLCSRIIVLETGRVLMDGAPAEIRADKRLEEIYLGKFQES